MKSYKIYVDTANKLCEINLLGYSMIYQYMIENGHKIIDEPSDADFIIINSCGFTKGHEHKSVILFNKLYSKKEKKASIILFGCLIKINEKLIDSLDAYPIDFNEGKKFDKIFCKKTKFEDIKPSCDTKKIEHLSVHKQIIQPLKFIPFLLSRFMSIFSKELKMNLQNFNEDLISKNKILVEICKGCASNCSYCAIKKARGDIHSRQINDILNDIEKLYDPTKELFFVADDCSSYGLDINTNLFDLLHEINKKFPELFFNLDNINPYWLEKYPDEYIKLFSECNIRYVTIPLQSGSNRILKDMNRIYDVNKILNITKKIKKISPKTAVYAHFIICYPNEKFIDFLKSIYCSLFFDVSLVFVYSDPKNSRNIIKSNLNSRFKKLYRTTFFKFLLNFVIFYKLLMLSNKMSKNN